MDRPGRRFHWRDADEPLRRKAIGLVAGLPALHLVVGTRLDPRRQERARRHCLVRLLYELHVAGAERLCLESRTPRQNTRDIQVVDGLRSAGAIGQLHVDHGLPGAEPLLWLPDIVAGAVNAGLAGDDTHLTGLRSLISRYDIELR